ncbi:hypothetical protein PS685_05346 [Pseudomonas fluorescens]|uniref:Uncharacterized protein n=1 Tax=Pseudomonas fluorescens TaxID=294 RepID=A0A5E7AMG8_PSEFL|nr:hypothetical protein PS685_05346 [Pseudomonas fluorescens]
MQKKIDQGDLIIDMDPRHPLSTVADRPAQPQFERHQQPRQKAALGRQYQPGTNQDHANSQGFGTLRGLLPGDAQLTGEIIDDRRRLLGQFPFATVAIPADGGARDQYLRFLLAAFEPGQHRFGQCDPAAPEQRLALGGPWPVGNRRPRQIDNGIDGFLPKVFEQCDTTHLCPANFCDFFRRAAQDRQTMPLTQPVSAELTSYQTSTAGQQYVHDYFLAWRLTLITSLFL